VQNVFETEVEELKQIQGKQKYIQNSQKKNAQWHSFLVFL